MLPAVEGLLPPFNRIEINRSDMPSCCWPTHHATVALCWAQEMVTQVSKGLAVPHAC